MKYSKKKQRQKLERRRLCQQHLHGINSNTKLFRNFLFLVSFLAIIKSVENGQSFNVAYQIHEPHESKEPPNHQIDMYLKYRPKFFHIFHDAFEKAIITKNIIVDQYRDTRESLNRIYNLINDLFSDPAPRKSTIGDRFELMGNNNATHNKTSQLTSTTTEYKLTRYELGRIFGRNFRGIQRLTDIEWRDALNQSKYNLNEYKEEANRQFTNNNLEDKTNLNEFINKSEIANDNILRNPSSLIKP